MKKQFGPYVIESTIGSGGMGVVYRAHDPRLDRVVAIKVIQPQYCDSPSRRQRFETEARSAARLTHPNVVAIYDVGEDDGTPYIVTEFVKGGTLGERLAHGPLGLSEALPIAIAVAEGLAEAHQRGIIHRDLKPANVLLTESGIPKISDFGLAKCLDEEPASSEAATSPAMTREGMVMGTPAYMSPEQAAGQRVDFRTDIFSFGSMLREMFPRKVPARVAAVIKRCTATDPDDRYAATSDLVRELRAAVTQRWRPRWLAAGFAAILVIVIATIALVSRPRPSQQASKINSLAILPLQNFSPDPSQTYFADAMTEELTAGLASLRSLRVTSRTSSSAYRKSDKPMPAIAKELGVDALIEGSVMRDGDRARVTVQLIDGRTDRHVWARTFDRRGTDVLALQRDVVAEIVEQIRLTLSPVERERLNRLPTDNVDAYQVYLRATYKLQTPFTRAEDVDEALANAEQAVALDPNFAEAYVTVARACSAKIFGWGGGKEFDEKGHVALGRALAIDPSLASAYAARGSLSYTRFHGYDIGAALGDYRRALALNPNFALAHHSACSELNHAGLHDLAIAECTAALRLDPNTPGPKLRLARAYWQSNRFAEAVAAYERFDISAFEKAVSLGYLGRMDEARQALDIDRERRGSTTLPLAQRYADADRLAADSFLSALQHDEPHAMEKLRRSAELGRENPHFHHAAFVLAAACAELNKPEEAVRWLTVAANTGMPNYPLFDNNPSLRKLHGQPVYDAFMRSLRVRWEQIAAQAK